MRKFILNSQIIHAIFGAHSVLKVTREGPRDWRLILMWVSWVATTVIAVGTIVKRVDDRDDQLEF